MHMNLFLFSILFPFLFPLHFNLYKAAKSRNEVTFFLGASDAATAAVAEDEVDDTGRSRSASRAALADAAATVSKVSWNKSDTTPTDTHPSSSHIDEQLSTRA
jgi:hypothetical protein